MNRLVKSLFIYILYLIIVIYMVHEAAFIVRIETYDLFMESYFRTVQKHLFNVMLIISFYLIAIREPYLKPEYRIRHKENLLYSLLKKGIVISIKWTLYMYSMFIIIPWLFGYDIVVNNLIIDTSRLFTYIFSLYILANIFYTLTGNELKGVLFTSGLNFLCLTGYLGISFYVVQGGIPEKDGLNYLQAASSLINILGICYLYYYFKYKDSLQ